MKGCAVVKNKIILMNKKSYILLIINQISQTIIIGRLGKLKFNKGLYIYLGSARKNMLQRINRHLSNQKKKFWHIDFLLMSQGVKVKEVWIGSKSECTMAQLFLENGAEYIRRFGSSDCRCLSHLIFVEKGIDKIKKILKKNGFKKFDV